MKKNSLHLSLLGSLALALSSCGGGGGGGSSSGGAVNGPISYDKVFGMFDPSNAQKGAISSKSSSATAVRSAGGCGTVMSNVGAGLTVAGGFVSLIPEAGPVLGAVVNGTGSVLSLFGASAGNTCVENQISNITQQLSAQQNQINNIVNDLQLGANAFYQANYKTAVQIAGVSSYNLQQTLGQISGNNGQFTAFMQDAGLWNLANAPIAGASLQNVTLDTMLKVNPDPGTQASFRNAVQDISGTSYNPSSCGNGNCYSVVTQMKFGTSCTATAAEGGQSCPAVIQTLNSLGNALQSAVAANTNAGTNIVPLFDQYNNSVVSVYQQTLYALQQAFTVEYMVNQMNYYYAAANPSAGAFQLDSYGGVEGTYYAFTSASYDAATEASNYNEAQKQLTAMYASRVNSLFINTINYIASDVPIGTQAYPNAPATITIGGQVTTDPNPVDYITQVGAALRPQYPIDEVGMSTDWSGTGALYQYSGLNNVNTCVSSVESYNSSLTGATGTIVAALGASASGAVGCPSIFTVNGQALNGSYFDGNTFAPYISVNDQIFVASAQADNWKVCSQPGATQDMMLYSPTSSSSAAGLEAGQYYPICAGINTFYNNPDGNGNGNDIADYDQQGGAVTKIGGTGANVTATGIGSDYQICSKVAGCGTVLLNYWPPSYSGGTEMACGTKYCGWGFQPSKDGSTWTLNTYQVQLQTGQTVLLPYGLFLSSYNNYGGLFMNAPQGSSLSTSGFTCISTYSSDAAPYFSCTFIDGTIVGMYVNAASDGVYGFTIGVAN